MTMYTDMDTVSLLNMFQVCDSMFPIGAFTLSNGLETFVQKDKLLNAGELKQYIENYISFMPYNELGFFSLITRGEMTEESIVELDQLYGAMRTPREIREGSEKLCKRFIKAWKRIEALPSLEKYEALIKSGKCDGHYTIALSLFVKDKMIDSRTAGNIYAYSIIMGIITNAVKTAPLSQVDGQIILNESLGKIEEAMLKAEKVTVEELGVGGTGFEIYAYNHETLYSRLYMS